MEAVALRVVRDRFHGVGSRVRLRTDKYRNVTDQGGRGYRLTLGAHSIEVDGRLDPLDEGWRDDADMKVNCFRLQHYGYDGSNPTTRYHKGQQTVWFDDVVIAKAYIGRRTAAGDK